MGAPYTRVDQIPYLAELLVCKSSDSSDRLWWTCHQYHRLRKIRVGNRNLSL